MMLPAKLETIGLHISVLLNLTSLPRPVLALPIRHAVGPEIGRAALAIGNNTLDAYGWRFEKGLEVFVLAGCG